MRLLVIEDDPRLSRLLGRLLEGEGHVVEVATDGETGLAIAQRVGNLDCIILDIGLPDMSGLQVAKRLRSSGSEVGILILSARDTVDDRVAGFAAGADDYLVKPFAFDEVAGRVLVIGRRNAAHRAARSGEPRCLDAGSAQVQVDPQG